MTTNDDTKKSPSDAEMFFVRRAALVSVGAVYEDYDGPLSDEMVASADRIIAERASSLRQA